MVWAVAALPTTTCVDLKAAHQTLSCLMRCTHSKWQKLASMHRWSNLWTAWLCKRHGKPLHHSIRSMHVQLWTPASRLTPTRLNLKVWVLNFEDSRSSSTLCPKQRSPQQRWLPQASHAVLWWRHAQVVCPLPLHFVTMLREKEAEASASIVAGLWSSKGTYFLVNVIKN